MGDRSSSFAQAALSIVQERIQQLRSLDFETAVELPEVDSVHTVIAGYESDVTTFRYNDAYQLSGKTLVVVSAARPTMLGMAEQHIELGLVYSPSEPVRDATETELQNSGG